MAVETGTANDYLDLWDKLIAFLTTNSDLTTAGENWTVAWQAPAGAPNESDCVLKGTGSGGTDEVLIGIRREAYQTQNSFFIRMLGMTGINATASTYDAHVNVSRNVVMFLDQNPMKYWFVANGRRFVVVVKISTVYEAMYGGLFLPFGDPTAYPYPLMVGGSGGSDMGSAFNWTSNDDEHSHFVDPYSTANISAGRHSSLQMLDPSAQWIEVNNNPPGSSPPSNAVAPWKWIPGFSVNTNETAPTGYYALLQRTTACLGGGFPLHPAVLVQNSPANNMYGAMDGVSWVPSSNNAAENLITIGNVTHLAVQNVFRTGRANYWALALE